MELYYGGDYSLVKSPRKNLTWAVKQYMIISAARQVIKPRNPLVADFYKRQKHYDELEKEIQRTIVENWLS